MLKLPFPESPPPPVPSPEDKEFPGLVELQVDATDIDHARLSVKETIPIEGPCRLTLVHPEWLPGFHSPEGPIELLAGLTVTNERGQLDWRRDPVNVYAFHIEVPAESKKVEVRFQHLSPTACDQGRVAFSSEILNLQWNTVLLHPAGHYARRISVKPSVKLPRGWNYACVLQSGGGDESWVHFEPCRLDVLVDSPLYAGCNVERHALDDRVHLTVLKDRDGPVPPERLKEFKALIEQADKLFGVRHFDRYEFLCCLSDKIGGIGVEHHRCCEIGMKADLFSSWDKYLPSRSVFCHEYVHSWNGKFQRGADSWQPCFLQPIRNSLMWVYEGLTQLWGEVLAVRSGFVTAEHFCGSLALTAASLQGRLGHRWRPMRDTTRDPIISSRTPLPWPSWQRSEDYYSEGSLLWLEIDMLLRELSDDVRSLDDFARLFFGGKDGDWITSLYTFDDVCNCLWKIAPFDWHGHLRSRLDTRTGPPLDALAKAGWSIAFRDRPTSFHEAQLKQKGLLDHQFSVGLIANKEGLVKEIIWESAAFKAGMRSGDHLVAVDGEKFSSETLRSAINKSHDEAFELSFTRQGANRKARLSTPSGLQYPTLRRTAGRDRLSALLRSQ